MILIEIFESVIHIYASSKKKIKNKKYIEERGTEKDIYRGFHCFFYVEGEITYVTHSTNLIISCVYLDNLLEIYDILEEIQL